MVAKSGDALLAADATAALISELLPLATVITPNLPEAGVLLGEPAPESLQAMHGTAERLRQLMGPAQAWVLLKGGHLEGDMSTDLLYDGTDMIELPGKRIVTRNTHGTGCTLSSSIAALIPQNPDVPSAVRQAKQWLTAAIASADQLNVGSGHGPVHHFHAMWRAPDQR